MIFTLLSNSTEFQVTFQNERLYFGNIKNEMDCFVIHSSRFVELTQKLIKITRTLYKNQETQETLFCKKSQTNHMYFWHIMKETNKEEFYIKLLSKDLTYKEVFFLNLDVDVIKFLACFRYFLLTSLPLSSNSKMWLKHCTTLDLEKIKNSYFDLYQETLSFSKQIKIDCDDCDIFDHIELFHYYFSLISACQKLSVLIND